MQYHFQPKNGLSLNSSLHDIAEHIHEVVYSTPHQYGEPRLIHGMAHVTRVMVLTTSVYHLAQTLKLELTGSMTDHETELKLLQVAALLHDSGCTTNGKDIDDLDSGLNIFSYFTEVLGVEPNIAKEFANACANKDEPYDSDYVYDLEHLSNPPKFKRQMQTKERSMGDKLRLILQMGDCLDYFRTRKRFEIKYAQLYQKFSKNIELTTAIHQLIVEARSLAHATLDNQFKNGHGAYQAILNKVSEPKYALISRLASPTESLEVISDNKDPNINAFHLRGYMKLFFRGITLPASRGGKHNETSAELEVRKTLRRIGRKTLTNKPDNTNKQGNERRSTTLLMQGAINYTRSGFGMRMPGYSREICTVHIANASTGYGKKEIFRKRFSQVENEKILTDIETLLKQGGEPETSCHTEVLINISQYDCVIYSNDAVGNMGDRNNIIILESIHLQKVYSMEVQKLLDFYREKSMSAPEDLIQMLPIYEYSYLDGTLSRTNYSYLMSDEDIFSLIDSQETLSVVFDLILGKNKINTFDKFLLKNNLPVYLELAWDYAFNSVKGKIVTSPPLVPKITCVVV